MNEKINFKHHVITVLLILLSVNITFYMSEIKIIGPVLASALVGLISSLFLPKFTSVIYCSSFIGMSSSQVGFQYLTVSIATLIAYLIYILMINYFNGLGGKLGTIAFISSMLISVLFL